MLFSSWETLGRVLATGALTYAALVLILRISGKRTLSKMNAFDFVVTVALGSTLATTILSQDSAVLDGVAALGLLIGLQFAITWMSVRWTWFQRLVKSQPALVYYRGSFIEEAMKRQRVTTEEVRSAVRKQGASRMASAEAVVLETDGSFTVLELEGEGPHDALANVAGVERFEELNPGDTHGPIAN